MRSAIAVLVAVSAALGSCTDPADAPAPTPRADGPYVVTAIDYHFHDAHPSLPISAGRAVEFSNQGANLHNVTFPGTDFDRMIRPGRRLTVDPVSSLVGGPGRYPFYCKLHTDRGMTGVLVVTG